MKYVIVGTAGHIDHGKTSLVKAITGVDTDRLPEEKARGITIDIGFAHYQLSPEVAISFVDVPGHERLVKNMIAGACGIDMVLLVIAADEGVMPQTVEHTHICQILGIEKGVVAVNKIDKVDEGLREIVLQEVKEFLQNTPFKDAPVVPVSAVTGEGIDELKLAIEREALSVEKRKGISVFRMPIDRVFTVKGFGTVVTGTVFSGEVKVKDTVEVLPAGKVCRVRNIQVRGEDVERSQIGYRTALNLQSVGVEEVNRGDVVAAPGFFEPTDTIDGWIFLLEDAFPLKDLASIRVHVATAEVIGRVKLLDRDVLKPGESCYCRIHLNEELVCVSRDPFVMRSYSPVHTIGGGKVLDAVPDKRRIKRSILAERLKMLDGVDDVRRLELFLSWSMLGLTLEECRKKALDPGKVEETLKELVESNVVLKLADYYVHSERAKELFKQVEKVVEEAVSQNRLATFVSYRDVAHALKVPEDVVKEVVRYSKKLVATSKGIALKGAEDRLDEETRRLVKAVEEVYLKAGFKPKSIAQMFAEAGVPQQKARAVLKYMLEKKILVRVSVDLALHKKYADEMLKRVERFFADHQKLEVSHFKEIIGVSRKYAIPYLEFLDRSGVTKRVGNYRVKR